MSKLKHWGMGALGLLTLGCAQGSVDDFELGNGTYELSTTRVEGDCVIEGGITAGSEFEGKLSRVVANTSTTSVKLEVCNDFFEDACHPEPFIEPVTLLRSTSDLRAENNAWEVPSCTCFEDYRGTRRADGTIVEDGRAELVWTFELPAAPDGCTCEIDACTMTVEQVLLRDETSGGVF